MFWVTNSTQVRAADMIFLTTDSNIFQHFTTGFLTFSEGNYFMQILLIKTIINSPSTVHKF